jgi:hypothetical protein
MSMEGKEKFINEQLEKLTLKEEPKYEDEELDDAIVNAMKSEHKSFCLQVESFLNSFLLSNKSTDIIGNMDKYQRKIVHKVCDIYRVKREYVDVKSNDRGDITISKTEESRMPNNSIEKRYSRYVDEQKKQMPKQIVNPFANKKLIVKAKEKKPSSESESSDGSSNENSQGDVKGQNEDVEQRKQQDYEKARDRIMQEQSQTTSTQKIIEKPKKKSQRIDQGYDPEYDRNQMTNNFNNPMGYYPPYNPYYQFQNYPTGQPTYINGPVQSNYPMPQDNRNDYANNFPSLDMGGKNPKKK